LVGGDVGEGDGAIVGERVAAFGGSEGAFVGELVVG